jgi:hypothetical protein
LDALRKLHKQTQKTYDYNLSQQSTFQRELDSLLATLSSASSSSLATTPLDVEQTLKSLDAMLSRARALRKKLADLEQQSAQLVEKTLPARVHHLASLPASLEDPTYAKWAQKRLSHQLVDYMLRAEPPMRGTARELAREEGVEELVDGELWEEMARVEKGLGEQKLDDVLSWVGENRTALKKLKVRFRLSSPPNFRSLFPARAVPSRICPPPPILHRALPFPRPPGRDVLRSETPLPRRHRRDERCERGWRHHPFDDRRGRDESHGGAE